MRSCVALAVVALALPSAARAQEVEAERFISVTISPAHILLPVVEATAEVKPADGFGLAAIAGKGTIRASSEPLDVLELGGQGRWYPFDAFEGFHLGAELMWLRIDGDLADVSAVADGVAIGPFVGWKLITHAGFTFEAQVGAQQVVASAHAEAGSASAREDDSAVLPLVNLNLGWSF